MKGYLLDTNLLIALLWPSHEKHDLALAWFTRHRAKGWVTCPSTQAGFVRVLRDQGKLEPATTPPSAEEEAALRVRLGLDVEPLPLDRAGAEDQAAPADCTPIEVPGRLSPEPGDEFSAVGPLAFVLHTDGIVGDPVPMEWTLSDVCLGAWPARSSRPWS